MSLRELVAAMARDVLKVLGGLLGVVVLFNVATSLRALGTPSPMKCPRIPVGWKMWVQVWNATNLDELSFFWGAHGYRG